MHLNMYSIAAQNFKSTFQTKNTVDLVLISLFFRAVHQIKTFSKNKTGF